MKKLHTYVNAKIVFRVGSELLVFRARDGAHYLPGGHLEYGEHPLDALRRELIEEMGYVLPAEPIVLGAWTYANEVESVHRITIAYLLDLPTKPEFQWIVPESQEGFEKFVWISIANISTIAIKPWLRHVLQRASLENHKSTYPIEQQAHGK